MAATKAAKRETNDVLPRRRRGRPATTSVPSVDQDLMTPAWLKLATMLELSPDVARLQVLRDATSEIEALRERVADLEKRVPTRSDDD